MRAGGITSKLYLGQAVLLVIALGLSAWWIARGFEARVNEAQERGLRTGAAALAARVAAEIEDGASIPEEFASWARPLLDAGYAVALLRDSGLPVVPEQSRGAAWQRLLSNRRRLPFPPPGRVHLRQERLFASEPTYSIAVASIPGGHGARVWVAMPKYRWWRERPQLQSVLIGVGVIVAGTLAALAYGVRRLWRRPLMRIIRTARRLSRGQLKTRVEVRGTDELALLAISLNEMRERLAAHVNTIDQQRRTLAALLNQLHEGVIASRPDGRIGLINPAAIHLLRLQDADVSDVEAWNGAFVEHVVTQHDLQRMLMPRTAAHGPELESSGDALWGAEMTGLEETRLQIETGDGVVHVLARASDLAFPQTAASEDEAVIGRLLVLTDITELGRALQMRTDFVANASHELRTPLSSIRAAVETLQSLDLATEADDADHFLTVIDRHSARLTALVSDLLDLARVESPIAPLEPRDVHLSTVFADLEGRFAESIARREQRLELVPGELAHQAIHVSPHLLRLVLDNLVDNAIKFTDEGGTIRVTVEENGDAVQFAVRDSGRGIPEDELARVFERFYQVERARSGAERGTGLGLSIVRHAIAAIGGSVQLESEEGEGTTVYVKIPRTQAEQ